MNVKNILTLAHFVDITTVEIRIDGGPNGLLEFTRKVILSTAEEIDMPSPADWLGLGYEQAEHLFEMKPYCPWCSEEQSERLEKGLAEVFNTYRPETRRNIIRDVLRCLAHQGWVDWKTAKHMNDVEVAA